MLAARALNNGKWWAVNLRMRNEDASPQTTVRLDLVKHELHKCSIDLRITLPYSISKVTNEMIFSM